MKKKRNYYVLCLKKKERLTERFTIETKIINDERKKKKFKMVSHTFEKRENLPTFFFFIDIPNSAQFKKNQVNTFCITILQQ